MCNQTLLLKGQYLYFDHFSSSAINWFLKDIYMLFIFYNYWLFRAILKWFLSFQSYQFCILSNYIIAVNIYYITWSVSIQHQYTFNSGVFSPVNYLGRWECVRWGQLDLIIEQVMKCQYWWQFRMSSFELIKGRWPLVPRRQGYMVRLNFETTVN